MKSEGLRFYIFTKKKKAPTTQNILTTFCSCVLPDLDDLLFQVSKFKFPSIYLIKGDKARCL